MAPALRIAVLEADRLPIADAERYGGFGSYTGAYYMLFKAGAKLIGLPESSIKMSKWDVKERPQQYPRLEDVDVVMISGSKFSVNDDLPWVHELVSYTRKVLAQDRVRLIGVCFGHQIVGKSLGRPIEKPEGKGEFSVCDVALSARGKKVFGKDTLSLHQFHKDSVIGVPEEVESLGASPSCETQGFYAARRLISLQAHPEFNSEIVTQILVKRHEAGVLNKETYDDGMARVTREVDSPVVGAAFLSFMLEGR